MEEMQEVKVAMGRVEGEVLVMAEEEEEGVAPWRVDMAVEVVVEAVEEVCNLPKTQDRQVVRVDLFLAELTPRVRRFELRTCDPMASILPYTRMTCKSEAVYF